MEQQIQSALEKQNPWWFGKPFDTGIPRLRYYPLLQKYLDAPEILLMLGARRTGKSTLLYQLISTLQVESRAILFINLDEPVFQSNAEDPTFLSALIEEYIAQQEGIHKFYIFIDEIQNYTHWAHALKILHDTNKQLKLVLTGSTAVLLQDAASTRLSGRYFPSTVYPLTFIEYLHFIGAHQPTLPEKRQAIDSYLQYGGFPRVALEKDETLRHELLKHYFQTIYLKDIIYPHNVRNNKDVFELLYFALSTMGSFFSYTNVGKTLHISADTVKEYLSYAEQSYLLSMVMKYDHSVRKQIANPRKIYCVDTGLINAVSFKFSENKGRLMENLVFLTLRKQQKQVFYHKGSYECDFIIRDGRAIVRAIQVTASLKDAAVKKRELKGLMEAMCAYNLSEGVIVTESERETMHVEGKTITILPLHAWLTQIDA